uniref:WD40 repeat n=1 Tax=Candidatus Kentrum sp. FW TaxID=2126338 RepID=A0A450T5X0_9GAMM|nr:MAG: WD40 repeat [Candidatus Kentron sp. FW]
MTETPPKLPVYLAALPQLQTLLRGTDITVTPGVWLGVHDLLLRLDQEGRLPPLARFGDLRALLSPLLCRNPEEQRRFKEIFRDWHIQVQAIQPDAVPGPETAEVDSGTALSGKWLQGAALPLEIKEGVAGVEWSKPLAPRGTRPWQSVVIALGILILAGLLWWGITRSPEEAIENQTETSLTEKSEEKSPQQEKLKTPDTVSTEISDTDASEQGLEPLPPRESPTLDPATHRDLDIIGVFLPWLPFLLALAGLGGYGWRHRRRIARQKRISEAESLYTAPPKGSTPSGYLRLEPPRNDLFGALPVQTALRRLHRPVLYPTRHLDTHATVRESVRRAGLFFPVYWERLRVPRLIVLVENRYAADPVTGLGALVVERLRAAGFIVHRYDYRGSPRAVWEIGKKPEESGGRHTLVDIAYRYPNSRLLLIGDPTTLLDPRGERVKTWVSEFGIWLDRAILGVRQDIGDWGKILKGAGFAVAPLGSNGLMELGARFGGGIRADAKDRDTPLPETLRRPPPRWLQPVPPDARELARLLRILRRFLGEDGFYLLGALAVYPRLHWGLIRILEYSLFPGVKDDPEPEPFDREARLLRLVQLPWFPRGWLPDWLRKALIHDLDADRRGRINKIYKELIYRKAGHENAPEGIEDVPIGPIVEPPSRGRLAGAVAGVLLLAGVLGAGMWGLWHGTPWWEWNLRSETEGFLLERQIAANGEHSFAIVGDNNHPELAKALRGTLREFGFIEEQGRLELDIEARLVASAGTRHEILLGPNADSEAAEEIARRLAWLTYRQSGTIAKTVSTSIPEGMIAVRLAADESASKSEIKIVENKRDFSKSSEISNPLLVIDTGGHKALIRDVIFTPHGRQLISVSDDKTIRIWDTGSGELLRTLRGQMGGGQEGKLYAGALSPDGRFLAVGGWLPGNYESRHSIRLIDLKAWSDAPVRLLKGHSNVIQGLAFSPDGKRLLSGSADDTARLWDMETGKILRVLRGHSDAIYAVAFSPPEEKGGERLVTGSDDQTLRLWDGDGNLLRVLEGHTDDVMAAAFTPDGRYLLSGSWDKTIRLWDARDGRFVKQLAEQNSRVSSLTISPDGKKVLTGSGSAPIANHVFAIPSGEQLLRFTEHDNIVLATAISPDGQLAATGGGDDNEISLWELATGEVHHKLVGKGNSIRSVGFARDGGSVAWGKSIGKNWSPINYGPLQQRFQLRRGSADGFDPTWGGKVADESRYSRAIQQVGTTRIRTVNDRIHRTLEILEDGRVTHTITLGSTDGYRHRSLTLTPDGRTVVSGGSWGVIASYDVATGKKRQEFIGHTGDVWAVAPSPDGRFLVSGSDDQTVRLWELATGKALLTIFLASDGEWVAWTPEGYYTASLNGDRLIGWHINQGEDRLARYYPAERFAGRFRKPRVVAYYLQTGGDMDEAIRLANLELLRRERIPRTDIPDIAPPMVFIKEPHELRVTTREPQISLIAEARSINQAGVEEIWVTVNGRAPVEGATRSFKNTRAARLETNLELEPGENLIAVYARNRHTSSEPVMRFVTSTAIPDSGKKPNLYLLAIGISDYADDGLDLRYADDDARAMARMLKAQEGRLYGKVVSRLLTNGKADGDSVLDGLDWLIRESTQRDVSVIFIAGHGMKDERDEYYFLPHDADSERLRRNGVEWSDFQDTLEKLPGLRWLLADTSHSGSITGKRAMARDASDITSALRDLWSVEGGVVVMSAATGREASLEKEEWGHGAFTKALIEGLEEGRANYNKDARIDIKELDLYVTDRVKELTGGRQHPMTEIPKVVPNFPVAIVE